MSVYVLALLAAVQVEPLIQPRLSASGPTELERDLGRDEKSSFLVLERSAPQALSRALLETGLLETLNDFELTPKTAGGGLDSSRFERVLVSRGEARTRVFAFDVRKALRYAFFRMPVHVDASADRDGGWSPDRLGPLKEALRTLEARGFALRPLDRDGHGNVFAWRDPSASIFVRFVPEDDELRILLIR